MSKLKVNELDTRSGTDITVTAGKTLDTSAGTLTMADDTVTYAKMQDTATNNRVLGAVTAGTISEVQIATDMVADNAVTLGKMEGITRGSIIIGNASSDPAALPIGAAAQVLTSDGSDIAWAASAGGLPSQTSNSGKTLITDGTNASWVAKPNRNYLMNGNFDLWQRGTSFAGLVQSYTQFFADRWQVSPAGNGCAMTVSRQGFAAHQTDVPNNPRFFMRCDVTTAASSGSGEITCPIEDVMTLAGKVVVLSFYAKASAALNFTTRIKQNFGSGGSGLVHHNVGTASLTTSWQRFEFTTTCPSMSGKTVGSNSWTSVNCVWDNASTSNDIDLAQFQLEEGAVATPFEYQSMQQQVTACQRYYEKSYGIGVTPGATSDKNGTYRPRHPNSGTNGTNIWFKVTKRVVPTIVFYAAVSGNTGKITNMSGGASDINCSTESYVGETEVVANYTSTGGETNVEGHWTAESELT